MKATHEIEDLYICDKCKKVFWKEGGYYKHETKHICKECRNV